jgi:glucosamine 6-phosphate synthetase-like amidotransferase/phosphosugar isomerase protein
MCSILGFGLQAGHKITDGRALGNMLRRLFVECENRGPISSGAAFVLPKKIPVLKTNVKASDFINLTEYDKAEDDYICPKIGNHMAVIGHCRYPTKGTEHNNKNNHPIICGNVVGVHNGNINNDDELFRRFGEIKRIGEVDSEIIFALINHYIAKGKTTAAAIANTSSMLTGAYACAMVNRFHPHCLWLFRNRQPCEVVHFEEVGLVIWASTMPAIRKAIEVMDLGNYTKIEFHRNTGLGIDLIRNRINKFDLEFYSRRAHATY